MSTRELVQRIQRRPGAFAAAFARRVYDLLAEGLISAGPGRAERARAAGLG